MLNSNVEIIDIVAVYSDDKQTSNIEELWDDVSLLRDQIDLVKQLLWALTEPTLLYCKLSNKSTYVLALKSLPPWDHEEQLIALTSFSLEVAKY